MASLPVDREETQTNSSNVSLGGRKVSVAWAGTHSFIQVHTSLLKGETVTDLVTHIFDTELLTGLTNTESDHKTDFNDYKRTKPETQLFQRAQFLFFIYMLCNCVSTVIGNLMWVKDTGY